MTLTDKTFYKNCTNGKLAKGKLFVGVLLRNINFHVDWHQIDGEKDGCFITRIECFAYGENTAQHVHEWLLKNNFKLIYYWWLKNN